MDIDLVRLNLNQNSINVLKVIIGLIMFGVALDLKIEDFRGLSKNLKSLVAGLAGHYLIFPALTYIMILVLGLRPSIALGLSMVAICPAGNLANLFTNNAKGNTAISVGITSVTTLLAMFTMPISLMMLGRFIPGAEPLLTEIKIDSFEMLEGVFIIMGIPLIAGMTLTKFKESLAQKLKKILGKLSFVFLLFFIVGALAANFQHFIDYIHMIVAVVLLHNVLALATGLLISKITQLETFDTKGIVFPICVKNTALGLALVFQFFQGMGGMALIVAWWGITQITMGIITSTYYKKKSLKGAVA